MKEPLYVRVRKLRKERGITQKFMTQKLGYKSDSSYSAFELGMKRRSITIEQAQIIADVFGITLDELFNGRKIRESRTDEDEHERVTA